MITDDTLKLVDIIGDKIVGLATLILLSYVAQLASQYLHFRLTYTGKGIFERRQEGADDDQTTVEQPDAPLGRHVT